MNIKEFFRFNSIRFVVFVFILVFLPFIFYQPESSELICNEMEPSSCMETFHEPSIIFTANPNYLLLNILLPITSIGSPVNQFIIFSWLIFILKILVSYLLTCTIFYYLKRLIKNMPNI